jgi:hypothetical protein
MLPAMTQKFWRLFVLFFCRGDASTNVGEITLAAAAA